MTIPPGLPNPATPSYLRYTASTATLTSDLLLHNDGAPVEAVKQSIRRFGFAAPIIALERSRMIVAGHTRWKAATDLGLANVPVRFVDLDEGEAMALALADNKLGEMAEWDEQMLNEVIQGLDLEGVHLEDLGWTSEELDAMLSRLYRILEIPRVYRISRWILATGEQVTMDRYIRRVLASAPAGGCLLDRSRLFARSLGERLGR